MKLQKHLSRKIGNTVYSKWVITIPPKKIKEASWREGEEFEATVKGRTLILKPKERI